MTRIRSCPVIRCSRCTFNGSEVWDMCKFDVLIMTYQLYT